MSNQVVIGIVIIAYTTARNDGDPFYLAIF